MDAAKNQLKFLKDAHSTVLQNELKSRFNDLMHKYKSLKDSDNSKKQ